jgi:hypothetical protein
LTLLLKILSPFFLFVLVALNRLVDLFFLSMRWFMAHERNWVAGVYVEIIHRARTSFDLAGPGEGERYTPSAAGRLDGNGIDDGELDLETTSGTRITVDRRSQ